MTVRIDQSFFGEGESSIFLVPENSKNGSVVSLLRCRAFKQTGSERDAETDVFITLLHCQPAGAERERH